jgi:hypothetical protein
MAAGLGRSRKLTTLVENNTELRQGRRCNYGLKRLERLAAKELAIKRRGETTLERGDLEEGLLLKQFRKV